MVNHRAYVQGLRAELAKLAPLLFVTLVFNRATTLEAAWKTLDQFHARVDRKMLGPKWAKDAGRRTRFIAFAENVESNLHLHLAAVPADRDGRLFWKVSRRIWADLVSSGNMDIEQWSHDKRAIDYIVKQVKPGLADHIQFSLGYQAA